MFFLHGRAGGGEDGAALQGAALASQSTSCRDGGVLCGQGARLCKEAQRKTVLLAQGAAGGAAAANHTEARGGQASQAKRKEEVGPSHAARSQRTHG